MTGIGDFLQPKLIFLLVLFKTIEKDDPLEFSQNRQN